MRFGVVFSAHLQASAICGGSVDSGTSGDPIEGEVVVLAVPYEAATPLMQEYGKELSGKVVVDITNPGDWDTMDGLVTSPDSSAVKEIVAGLLRDGGLVAIDAGPLRRARELERLGFLGIALQQPLGLNFQSAWTLIGSQ